MAVIIYENTIPENISDVLMEHGMMVIKNYGNIELDHMHELAIGIGKPLVTDRHVLNEERTVQSISDNGLFGNNDVDWHNDWSYGRGSYFGSMLYAVQNASVSSTWFVDMSEAPDDLKDRYRGCMGRYYPPRDLQGSCFTARQLKLLAKQEIERPFVFDHPRSGVEVLYCSPGTIQDNDVDLNPIIEWANDTAYQHQWDDGDILIWDNLRMMHRRGPFEGVRELWRVQFII